MKVSHVFIDLDGVLADFISSAFAVHGARYEESNYPRLQWSIATVLGITESEFWKKIDSSAPDFWPNLSPYEWFDDVMCAAKSLGVPMSFLSSPSRHPSCHYGKRQWVDKYAPRVELILCSSKHLLAANGRVLIDDSDANIDKWRTAGGAGILFPQPWNRNHHIISTKRLQYVAEQLGVNDAQGAKGVGDERESSM